MWLVDRQLAVLVMLLVSLATTAQAQRTYPVYPVSHSPVIDGMIDDDPAWSAIPWAAGFHKIGRDDFGTLKQTRFRIGRDATYLYVAVRCFEPDIGNVESSTEDSNALWREDCTELLIVPVGEDVYRQYIINPNGARWSMSRSAKTSEWSAGTPLEQWRAAAHRGEDYWSFELAIPFDAIGPSSPGDEPWRFNVCRTIETFASGGDNLTAWSPMRTGYHEVIRYGVLRFEDAALTPEQAIAHEQQINAAYRDHLDQWIRAIASHAPRLRRSLAAGAQYEAYKDRARQLAQTLDGVEEVARSTDPSLRQLMRTYEQAYNLERAITDLEARAILDELFD